jgi:hypothetical protein
MIPEKLPAGINHLNIETLVHSDRQKHDDACFRP